MLALRALARSTPRALARTIAPSLRQSLARPRTLSAGPLAMRHTSMPSHAAFSTTVFRAASSSETDEDLSCKLDSELQIEEELRNGEQQPTSVKDFLENSPFELVDKPGQDTVKLVRKFGDEQITVSFSIADISDYESMPDDPALSDEELGEGDMQNPNRQNQVPLSGGARSAPAQEQMEEEEDEDIGEEPPSTPISLTIVVEKPGKTAGALTIDAMAADGNVSVENVFFYDDAKLAKVDTPESAQKRARTYPGPPFGSLDEDLQVLVERYLEERGINQAMSIFVADFADVKEQKEYTRWLGNVKKFIDA
ncbi:hypothetical protein CDD82_4058 [Ophiocordyceps australis]|uniref:Mitochondrial glyco protein n=1 Tax=Ophiocordyceps australis TaxID=1399860 RepID=A0A2C5Z8E9_9HYPO|nr:hypothetical protein CDD82_4058 [Ophiocordyceps australis]